MSLWSGGSTSRSEQLLNLASVNHQEVEQAVKGIKSIPFTGRKPTYLLNIVESASAEFPTSTSRSKHLVVFTTNFEQLTELPQNDTFQLHLMCPSLVPWKQREVKANNGWCVSSCLVNDTIEALISHARSSYWPHDVEDITIDIRRGPITREFNVRGETVVKKLKPGAVLTVIVVAYLQESSVSSRLQEFPQGYVTGSGEPDVVKELNAILLTPHPPALIVNMRYKNPASGGWRNVSRGVFLKASLGLDKKITDKINENTNNLSSSKQHNIFVYRLWVYRASTQSAHDLASKLEAMDSGHDGRVFLEELRHRAFVEALPEWKGLSLFPRSISPSQDGPLERRQREYVNALLTGSGPPTPPSRVNYQQRQTSRRLSLPHWFPFFRSRRVRDNQIHRGRTP